jgi:hypothetical protein
LCWFLCAFLLSCPWPHPWFLMLFRSSKYHLSCVTWLFSITESKRCILLIYHLALPSLVFLIYSSLSMSHSFLMFILHSIPGTI